MRSDASAAAAGASLHPGGGVDWMATSVREAIARAIEQDIFSGTFQVGQQLKQDAICQRFNVSAAPVREALRQLENDGLLIYRPNRGMFVAEVTTEELLGVLLPLRFTLEEFAMRYALERMNDERWGYLEELVRTMQSGARVCDWLTINEADVRFHELTVLWSDQPHTMQLWKAVRSRTRAQFYRLAPRHEDPHEVADEHAYLLEQFRTGDPGVISKALRQHIIVSADELAANSIANPKSATTVQ